VRSATDEEENVRRGSNQGKENTAKKPPRKANLVNLPLQHGEKASHENPGGKRKGTIQKRRGKVRGERKRGC